MPTTDVTLHHIFQAKQAITPVARETPLILSDALTQQIGANVYLKLETLQETGAFKMRGAANLSAAEKKAGVVTVSTGNHGRAVAYVADRLNLKATVCISERVPQNKVDALKRLNAEVVIHGQS